MAATTAAWCGLGHLRGEAHEPREGLTRLWWRRGPPELPMPARDRDLGVADVVGDDRVVPDLRCRAHAPSACTGAHPAVDSEPCLTPRATAISAVASPTPTRHARLEPAAPSVFGLRTIQICRCAIADRARRNAAGRDCVPYSVRVSVRGSVHLAASLLTSVVLLGACSEGDSAKVVAAADVMVLVAAPAHGGDDASISGTVAIVDGCLGINEHVAVWPFGTRVTDADGPVIDVPNLGTVTVGDQVTGAGGFEQCARPTRWARRCRIRAGTRPSSSTARSSPCRGPRGPPRSER